MLQYVVASASSKSSGHGAVFTAIGDEKGAQHDIFIFFKKSRVCFPYEK